jgi:hypothetical protein
VPITRGRTSELPQGVRKLTTQHPHAPESAPKATTAAIAAATTAATEPQRIPPGALVRDEALGQVGVLMAYGAYCDPAGPPAARGSGSPSAGVPTLAYLRPEGGGREWTADPAAITLLSPAEALHEKLRSRNNLSRRPRP